MERRWTLTLAIAVAVLLCPMLLGGSYAEDASTGTGDTGETDTGTTFYGYVANLSDQERNTPLEGVSVTLYDSDRNPLSTCTTDADGRFQFTFEYVQGNVHYLSFDYAGYMVRSLPDLSMEMVSDGESGQTYISFQLRPDMVDDQGDYRLTGTADGPHAIVMVITTGIVYGNVLDSQSGSPVSGATVTLVSQSGQTYTAVTGDNGYFSIECPYGTYTMTVSCNGYETSSQIEASTDNGSAYTVSLDQHTSELFLGLDSAHAMLVIGLVVLAVFLVVIALLVRHSFKPESEIYVENDLTPPSDDEVRRP